MQTSYNRLIYEKSPYLLQHAHQPVNWYPWGQEAFENAKKEDKPIFLSIGYASCHWCHVMERESFCDKSVARALNKTFVCVKVDREELPQVDALYMDFAQMIMGSSGGWPLHVILTPDLKPFYAMTYLPPRNKSGMMGLYEMTQHIGSLWEGKEKQRVYKQSDHIFQLYQEVNKELLEKEFFCDRLFLEEVTSKSLMAFDAHYGGKKGAPKFPLSFHCDYLLQYASTHPKSGSALIAELTLDMMRRGGIYDHIGGGFCCYSVDDKWMIPHFEKILSDNALLALTYIEAYRFYKKKDYAATACDILEYLSREMKGKEALFYSSQDAESDEQEGVYYTWELSEIEEKFEKEDFLLFCEFYNLSQEGNFEGRNVLFQSISLEEFAKNKNLSAQDLKENLCQMRAFLRHERNYRKIPEKDKKYLLSWNALTLEAFFQAGKLFKKSEYTKIAKEGFDQLKACFYKEGRLFRRYREGEAKYEATLEDYVALVKLCLTFHHYGEGGSYLELGKSLLKNIEENFKAREGGYYESSVLDTTLALRRREWTDSSLPCSQALLASIYHKLSLIEQDLSFEKKYIEIIQTGSSIIKEYPSSSFSMLKVLHTVLCQPPIIITIALDENKTHKEDFIEWLSEQSQDRFFCMWKDPDEQQYHPYLKDKTVVDGQTAFYVCHNFRCLSPIISFEQLKKVISHL